jgi:nucleotide-binding universal stress UspA family protein
MAEKVIVGYDGSEHAKRALEAAIAWAHRLADGEIIIMCAQERPDPGVGPRGLQLGVEEMYDELLKRIEQELAEAAAKCQAAGVRSATVCTAEPPDEAIAKAALEAGASLIVVGVKGTGAREGQRTQLGSTTNKVLHEAGGVTPVLVV